MKYLLAFLLLCSTATGATFHAWVGEDWKANVTDWTVLVHDSSGALAGKVTGITATDLGANSGANVQGTVNTTGTLNQRVTVFWIDTDTNYVATSKGYYLDGAGNIDEAPTELAPGGASDAKIDDILADTNEMQTDQADGTGRLDAIWKATDSNADATKTDTTAIIATQGSHTTSLGNIYTDTQALQPLLSGVNVTLIEGGDATTAIENSVWDALGASHNTPGTMGAILQAAGQGDPSAVAAAVWDEARAGHVAVGSFGETLGEWANGQRLDLILDQVKADTNAIITTQASHTTSLGNIYTDTQALQPLLTGVNVTQIEGADPTATIASSVWSENSAAYNTAGTFGLILKDLSTGGISPGEVAAAVWDAPRTSHVAANSMGAIQGDWSDGQRLDLILDATKADTSAIIATQGTHTTSLGNIYTDTQALQPLLAGVNVTQIEGADPTDTMAIAVWDEARAGNTNIGTFGETLNDWANGQRLDLILDNVGADTTAIIATQATHTTNLADIETDTNALQALLAGVNVTQIEGADATDTLAAQAATGVWDALTANHAVVGSFGELVKGISTGQDPSAFASAVWSALRADNLVPDSMGDTMSNLQSLFVDWQPAGRLELVLQDAANAPGTTPVVLTDVDQEPVPTSRSVVLVRTSGGLVGEMAQNVATGVQETWAVDFRNDLSANERIQEVAQPVVVSGPTGGISFPTLGRDKSLAKLRVAAAAAGKYVVDITVTYNSGAQARGRVTFNAVQ